MIGPKTKGTNTNERIDPSIPSLNMYFSVLIFYRVGYNLLWHAKPTFTFTESMNNQF